MTIDPITATPPEIDTEIALLTTEQAKLAATAYRINNTLGLEQRTRAAGQPWFGERHDVLQQQLAAVRTRDRAVHGQLEPLHAEFQRRGGWTRYYLVDSHNGHVHSSTRCSSCYPTTEFYWLTSESGRTPQEVVADAGSQACTVCFPWAPVDVPRGRYRTPQQEAAEKAAGERAAARARIKANEITTPDGEQLFEAQWHPHHGIRNGSRIKTERAAWNRALADSADLTCYGADHPSAREWTETVARCVAALAHRRGVTEDSLRAEIADKVAAKRRREGW